MTNDKRGFLIIGKIDNMKEYPAEIRKYTKKNVDFNQLNDHVDTQWNNCETACLCYSSDVTPVLCTDSDVMFFLIETGYFTEDTAEIIYGGFRKKPGCQYKGLKSTTWSGVEIGTKEVIINKWKSIDVNRPTSLDDYTLKPDYSYLANMLNWEFEKNEKESYWHDFLNKAFLQAIDNDEWGECSKFAFFNTNLSIKNLHFWAKMDKFKGVGPTKWFGLNIVTEDELIDDILDEKYYHFGRLIFTPSSNGDKFLAELSQLAMKEKWNSVKANSKNDILRSYITHTLDKLFKEDAEEMEVENKKVQEFKNKLYFNSGLLNRRYFRQIIICGEKIVIKIPGLGKRQLTLIKNPEAYVETDKVITCVFDGNEFPVPGIANYFANDDKTIAIFNTKYKIVTNDKHIFEDGVKRGRLPKYSEEYNACADDETEKDQLLARIARDFDSAISRAVLLAERNYKLALPQYWPETGKMQFLLPIYLGEREETDIPQCALVLSLDETGRTTVYRGTTILTLEMAYNNARLIAKPDAFWLETATKD